MDASRGSEPNSHPRKIDKVALLAQCPLFAGLSQWELRSISQLMRLVEYRKDELIYREGGEAESFYVVVSGRFEAYSSSGEKKKVFAYLRRGDYFGEMSLLTGQPHSATLRALSDSLVLEIKKDDFKRTIEHNATISIELSRRLSSRLKVSETRSLLKSDVIAVYGHQSKAPGSFSLNLAASLFLETQQKTILLDIKLTSSEPTLPGTGKPRTLLSALQGIESHGPEYQAEFIERHPSGFDALNLFVDEDNPTSESALIPLLNHLSLDYRFLLLFLPDELDEVSLKALSQSDRLFFLTDSHLTSMTEAKETIADIEKTLSFPPEKIALVIQESFFGIRTTGALRAEIFGGKRCFSLPDIAQKGGDPANPVVVRDPGTEYSLGVRHMARYLSGNLVGLALGSGAAFGLAHIGVLKVLEREKIPIDIISGSSIGALIGSLYAVGLSAAEIEKTANEINIWSLLSRLIDINVFPMRGLIHGNEVIRHFRKHLGKKTFENCRVSLKITGANLSSRQSFVYDSGSVAEAVRASIAIPALIRPVFREGDTIVDGGILNPLPIQALHQAGANKVIAVNVFPTTKDLLEKRILRQERDEKRRENAKEKGLFASAFWALRVWTKKLFFPNIFDILMNTIQSMEAEIAEVEGESADLLLRPILPEASWVDFYKARAFIRRGEEEAVKLLPKIKALVSQQII